MSKKTNVRIRRVRLIAPAPLGKTAVIETHVSYDSKIDGKPIKILFDADSRFVRVEADHGVELIPFTNIASIWIDTVEEAAA